MNTLALPGLKALNRPMEMDEKAFGFLRDSNDILGDGAALRARMEEDGYLVIRGLHDRNQVIEGRLDVCEKLCRDGLIEPGFDEHHARCVTGKSSGWAPHYAERNPKISDVVYGPRTMAFFDCFLGGKTRHFDYTWFRPCSTGVNGAPPHCDVVYMGRGTQKLYTMWTPFSDVSLEMGPLMILENSYKLRARLQNYLSRDVDTFCTNYPDGDDIAAGKKTWHWDGWLTNNPISLRQKYGTRWLTTPFQMGDALIFSIHTIHAFID
ncbi:MAG: phytanoyl-CoA dioxygenase family protein, partial [Verrucomicrobiae bacterium]|nr:phytanoyl-CoA dioxygenase family protein [Verrucomicrobiae bacterium]